MSFEPVIERPSFPEEEEKILKYWREENVFLKSYEKSKGRDIYTFYDGPPFATGLPHYGHILAGTIKDIVTRYAHQSGYCVERRFGWDCHGLPVEHEIDKMLQIKQKQDVLAYGIANYNEKCRSIVMRYANEWRSTIERLGRWIDFDNDYKTLDVYYMESVWWVFASLFKKNLVYRSFKVMPYSFACNTPLSNFEANLNYKDIKDPSIVVTFPLINEQSDSRFADVELLAWTTTPWTLPSNLAVCVHPNFVYCIFINKLNNKKWIVTENRLNWVCKELKLDIENKDIEIIEKINGSELEGQKYLPLFDFFYSDELKNVAFRIVADEFVTDDAGTGLVHCAPAFGEQDFRVCKNKNIIRQDGSDLFCAVDDDGKLTSNLGEFAGLNFKDADKPIKANLKMRGRLIVNSEITHSYPFCWRSDTPLIYKAVPSWFIRVEEIKENLINCNNQTYWVPNFVKEKRFHNWLMDARDWCVSRNRYWGTPIPLWISEDFSQIICIGSISELEKYAGRKLDDIHRHFIDDIEIPDPRGKEFPNLKRIEEVFDCWFESGSMPYAQQHFPFENKEKFEEGFPADFVAEGLDQTRGWFYTLMVLSTALFNKPAFKNIIVNGLVLAADGKKMSKRLKNYPDPTLLVNEHGADALRLYLVTSPVVRGESLRFKADGLRDIVKDVFLPWYHAYRFLTQEVMRLESQEKRFRPSMKIIEKSENLMDIWIISSANTLIEFVHKEMKEYRLYTVTSKLLLFLEQLTNWYVRLNRDRMRGTNGVLEAETALCTLFEVLMIITRLMAPYTPFISDMIYRNLRNARKGLDKDEKEYAYLEEESIHYTLLPESKKHLIKQNIETKIERMQSIIIMSRSMRENRKMSVKTPLKELRILHSDKSFLDDLQCVIPFIKEEVNVMEVYLCESSASSVKLSATPNFKVLGSKIGSKLKEAQVKIKELSSEEVSRFEQTGEIEICGCKLDANDITITKAYTGNENSNIAVETDKNLIVMLDFTMDESLQRKAFVREVANRVQKMRKNLNLSQNDMVDMWYSTKDKKSNEIITTEFEYLLKCLRRPIIPSTILRGNEIILKKEEYDIYGSVVEIIITKSTVHFNEKFSEEYGKSTWEEVKKQLETADLFHLKNICADNGGAYKLSIKGKEHLFYRGKEFALGTDEAAWLIN